MFYNIEFNKKNFSQTIESFNEFLSASKCDISNSMLHQIEKYKETFENCHNFEVCAEETFSRENVKTLRDILTLKEQLKDIENQVYFNLGTKFSSLK